jgi:hypothetical protein
LLASKQDQHHGASAFDQSNDGATPGTFTASSLGGRRTSTTTGLDSANAASPTSTDHINVTMFTTTHVAHA